MSRKTTRNVGPWLGGLPLVVLALLLGVVDLPAQDGVDATVRDLFRAEGSACVFVQLAEPGVGRADGASPASSAEALPRVNLESQARVEAQLRLLNTLPAATFILRYQYRFSSIVVLDVLHEACLDALDALPEVVGVTPDAAGHGSLQESLGVVRAHEVLALGIRGSGITIAVLDSGVEASHPALDGAVVLEQTFLGRGTQIEEGAADGNGHGSHVAGVIASRGGSALPHGVAPGTQIVAVKVLNDNNKGWVSDWVAGLEFVVSQQLEDNGLFISAVNMSLATDAGFSGVCDEVYPAFSAAAAAAREAGMVLVASAGNAGSTRELASPACLEQVISVGMTTDTEPEEVVQLSNRNEHLDLMAPGEDITSLGLGGSTRTLTGTSFSSPHVVGAIALLLELDPTLSAEALLTVFRETGVPIEDSRSGLVFPRLDILAAVTAAGPDCDGSGAADIVEIHAGTLVDCDGNGRPDECDIRDGLVEDLNGDSIPDACDPRVRFHRGDVDSDGRLAVTDGVQLFNFLFLGEAEPTCLEAANSNNDASVDITDGVFLLNFLFQNYFPAPAPPGSPAEPCGLDPEPPGSVGDLGCGSYPPCDV